MTKDLCVKNLRVAIALQTELCFTQIEELERSFAKWHGSTAMDDDFPIEDFQKLDSIKQRLADVIGTLRCPNLAAVEDTDVDGTSINLEKLKGPVRLCETLAAVRDGETALRQTKRQQGELSLF